MTDILAQELGTDRVAVLSGPNLAVEVAAGSPAATLQYDSPRPGVHEPDAGRAGHPRNRLTPAG